MSELQSLRSKLCCLVVAQSLAFRHECIRVSHCHRFAYQKGVRRERTVIKQKSRRFQDSSTLEVIQGGHPLQYVDLLPLDFAQG